VISSLATSFLKLISAQLEETSRGVISSHHFHNVQCGIENILSLIEYNNEVVQKMFICSTMSLGARVSLLLVPLVTALDPAAAHATQSADFAGLVDVGGGRKMYLECRGKGSPTIVLVAGLSTPSVQLHHTP
jgi:hypothetical protein